MDLAATYRTFTGKRIDANSLSYWTGAVSSGKKTAAAFDEFVAASDDYKSYVKQLLRTACLERIGAEPGPEVVEGFFAAHSSTPADAREVDAYVGRLPAFTAKYAALIEVVHSSMRETDRVPLTPDVIASCLDKFRADAAYGSEGLLADLQAPSSAAAPPHDSAPAGGSGSAAAPARSEYPKWADAFEAAFGRPVFLQEYIKYDTILRSHVDAVKLLAAYRENYEDVYGKASTIFRDYTGAPVPEYTFVKAYLDRLDDPAFLSDLKAHVLGSDEYRRQMHGVLTRAYTSRYDQALDPSSATHVFNKALLAGMALDDARIRDLITGFKEETDGFVDRIYKIHLELYQRDPDAAEVSAFLDWYREDAAAPLRTDARVTRALMEALEFHDVLKRKIRAAHVRLHGSDVGAGALYRALEACLGHLGRAEGMEQVEQIVDEAVA